jgi:hypothetical protein
MESDDGRAQGEGVEQNTAGGGRRVIGGQNSQGRGVGQTETWSELLVPPSHLPTLVRKKTVTNEIALSPMSFSRSLRVLPLITKGACRTTMK